MTRRRLARRHRRYGRCSRYSREASTGSASAPLRPVFLGEAVAECARGRACREARGCREGRALAGRKDRIPALLDEPVQPAKKAVAEYANGTS